MNTKEIINKIDMGQSLVNIGIGMNNNGHFLSSSDWLYDDNREWDYYRTADDEEIKAIKLVEGTGNDYSREHWFVFGSIEVDKYGYLTGIQYCYASYNGE